MLIKPTYALAWALVLALQLSGCARAPAKEPAPNSPKTDTKETAVTRAEPKQSSIEMLDRRYISEPYHIYYTDKGDSAFGGSTEEADRLAQAMARKLSRGQTFYENELGLDFVLKQPRFREVANIDVRMSYMRPWAMGNAGSGRIQVNRNPHFFGPQEPAPKSLRLSISTRWRPANATPEHEVFHLFQYGYGFFANLWYLEGLAGGLAPAFDDKRGNVYDTAPLPTTQTELQTLLDLDKPHGAGLFWRRLMGRCEPGCPSSWQGDRYAVTDVKMCGKRMVGSFMKQLPTAEQSVVAFRGPGYDPWAPLQQPRGTPVLPPQRDRYENNYWLLRSLLVATRGECRSGHPELTAFQDLLDDVLQGDEGRFTQRMGKLPYNASQTKTATPTNN